MGTVGWIRQDGDSFLVGARDASSGYDGPTADVRVEPGRWVHIITDDYDGHAMLNLEALPELIVALQELQKRFGVARTPAEVAARAAVGEQ